MSRLRRNAASVIITLVATTQLVAQQSGGPPQAPAFRSSVEVVAVDFLAVDSQGRPLPDLKSSEVTLRVDGKPREVRSLQLVRTARSAASVPASPAAAPAPAPFADNQETARVDPPAEGATRTVVFVVDHEHIRPGYSRVVSETVGRFLDVLSAGDRAALVTMPYGRVEADLTSDLDRVRRMAANVSGRTAAEAGDNYNIGASEAMEVSRSADPKNDPIVREIADFSCRLLDGQEFVACMTRTSNAVSLQALQMVRGFESSTRALISSLVGFLDSLSAVDGPKTLVLISEGFVPFPDTVLELRGVTSAAGRSRVQVYAIQPHIMALQDASRSRMAKTYSQDLDLYLTGLRDLSNSTGGHVLRLTGTAETVVARIERETSAHYLLGFEPTPGERDGKSHTIEVRVQRADVAIRARPEFTIGRPASAAGASIDRPGSTAAPPATPALMIRDDKTYRDLPMRALAYPFRSPDKTSMRVVVAVESPEPATRFSALAFSLTSSSGKTIAEWTADASQLTARPVVSATTVPPGDYRLRIAAADARGRLGAVNHNFSANLVAAGSHHVGGLMLGVTSQTGAFAPKLLFATADEDVTGYFEMYGTGVENGWSLVWELAASPDGPALASAEGALSATGDADRYVASGDLPIASLAPGDYFVRATIKVNDAVVARLSRAMRKQ